MNHVELKVQKEQNNCDKITILSTVLYIVYQIEIIRSLTVYIIHIITVIVVAIVRYFELFSFLAHTGKLVFISHIFFNILFVLVFTCFSQFLLFSSPLTSYISMYSDSLILNSKNAEICI